MKIATCKSRRQKQYYNQDISWSAFKEKLKETVRTKETVEEYKKLNKDKQADIKDVGGFVGGYLRDGLRNNQSVVSRSMITLDADYASESFLDDLELLLEHECVVYSTHKHTSEHRKYRVIIPMEREVTPEEYEFLARVEAKSIGIDQFDDTTYQSARMMFWPSTSVDGEYVYLEIPGMRLDPNRVLADHPDWKDISTWPRSSRETEVHRKKVDKQEDPLVKKGWVGAFCRAYTIQEAIETFIPDEYVQTDNPNRWTYANGSTAGGLVLYQDKFAYSNHATDPTGQMLCNAYDLVRLHKWPGVEKSEDFMNEMLQKDELTRRQLAEDKKAELAEDFGDFFEDERQDGAKQDKNESTNWLEKLEVDKKGNFRQTTDNIVQILSNDPKLKDGIGGVNQFAQKPVKFGDLPWEKFNSSNTTWTDTDDACLRYYLEKKYQIVAKGKTDDAVSFIHKKNTFNPVKNYLDSLKWDGVERLDTLFIDYLGAEDSDYTRAVARKSFTAAVARIYQPGCKMDYMAVLVGQQGIGKSHMLSIMGGEWFSDSITTISGKEGYEALHGSWIIEWSELSAAKKADIEAMKQFISKRDDRYRKAYERRVTDNPRQCVFFGTTNDNEFLRDYTGNRRFWPIGADITKAKKVVFEDLPKERDQIWAEAVVRYKDGEPLYLTGAALEGAEAMQEKYTYRSIREDMVRNYLGRKLPEDWKNMEIYARIQWLEDPGNEGTEIRDCVSLIEIWCEVLQGSKNRFTNQDQRELKAIMDHIGWPKGKAPRQRGKCYGKQRVYINPSFENG